MLAPLECKKTFSGRIPLGELTAFPKAPKLAAPPQEPNPLSAFWASGFGPRP